MPTGLEKALEEQGAIRVEVCPDLRSTRCGDDCGGHLDSILATPLSTLVQVAEDRARVHF
jgi:hypothetical protein